MITMKTSGVQVQSTKGTIKSVYVCCMWEGVCVKGDANLRESGYYHLCGFVRHTARVLSISELYVPTLSPSCPPLVSNCPILLSTGSGSIPSELRTVIHGRGSRQTTSGVGEDTPSVCLPRESIDADRCWAIGVEVLHEQRLIAGGTGATAWVGGIVGSSHGGRHRC